MWCYVLICAVIWFDVVLYGDMCRDVELFALCGVMWRKVALCVVMCRNVSLCDVM